MHRDQQGRRQFRDEEPYRSSYGGQGGFEDREEYERWRGQDMSSRDYESSGDARFGQERYGRSGYEQNPRWGRSDYEQGSRYGRSGYEQSPRYGRSDYEQGSRFGRSEYDRSGPTSESWNRNMMQRAYGDDYRMQQERWSPQENRSGYYERGAGYGGQSMMDYPRYDSFNEGMRRGGYGSGQYYGASSHRDTDGFSPYRTYGQGGDGGEPFGGQDRYGEQGRYGSFGSGYGTQGRMNRSQKRGPKGYKRSDDRIKEDICDRLSMQDMDTSDIEVSVSNGEVTLSGTVSERGTKYEAEQICDGVQGVNEINNNLRVKRSAESMSSMGASGTSGSNDSENVSRTQGRSAQQHRS